jgi:hypothetical protein
LIGSLVSFAGARLFIRGRRISLTHRRKGSPTTTPPGVLYLRPFRKDPESQRTHSTFIFYSFKTYEEQIKSAFERIGQVRAVTGPAEKLAPLGAERVPLPDEEWQSEVTEWIKKAHLILIRASPSPGVVWEVGQVLSLGRADSTLLLVPDDGTEYREFVLATRHLFPAALPSWDFDSGDRRYGATIGIVRFDAERTPIIVRLRFSDYSLLPLERALRRAISNTPALRALQELAPRPFWERCGRVAQISVAAVLTLCVALILYSRVSPAVESLTLYAASFHFLSDGRLGPFLASLPPEFGSGLRSALDQNPSAKRLLERSKVLDVEFTTRAIHGIQNLPETDLLALTVALRDILAGGQQPCTVALCAMISDSGRDSSFVELLTRSRGPGAYAPILLRAATLADRPLTPPSPRGEGDSEALVLAIGPNDARRFIRISDAGPGAITVEDACWFQQTWLRVLPTLTPATRRARFLRLYFLSFFPPRWRGVDGCIIREAK